MPPPGAERQGIQQKIKVNVASKTMKHDIFSHELWMKQYIHKPYRKHSDLPAFASAMETSATFHSPGTRTSGADLHLVRCGRRWEIRLTRDDFDEFANRMFHGFS